MRRFIRFLKSGHLLTYSILQAHHKPYNIICITYKYLDKSADLANGWVYELAGWVTENYSRAYSSTMSSGNLVGTLVNDFSLQFTMPPSSHEHGCGHEDFWSSTPGPHSTVSPSKSPSAKS